MKTPILKGATVTFNGVGIKSVVDVPVEIKPVRFTPESFDALPVLEAVIIDIERDKPTFQEVEALLNMLVGNFVKWMARDQKFTFHGKTITLDNIWRDWLVEIANRLDAVSECWDLLCRYHPDLQNSSNEGLLRKFNETCKK